jgi:hypothetical protein
MYNSIPSEPSSTDLMKLSVSLPAVPVPMAIALILFCLINFLIASDDSLI